MHLMRWPLLVAGLLGLAACSDKGSDTGALTGDASAGATEFSNVCAVCHGADGTGETGVAPSLVDAVPEYTHDSELSDIILNGFDEANPDYPTMPPQDLTDQQVADVIAYLRETFPG